MKVSIDAFGMLTIESETNLESYALTKWHEELQKDKTKLTVVALDHEE